MEVFKRTHPKSPFWHVDFVHPTTGVRVRQSLKVRGTKAEAQKAAVKLVADLERKGDKTSTSLREALEGYCTGLHSEGKASAGGQSALAVKCLQGLGTGKSASGASPRYHLDPNMPLERLTPAVLAKLVTERRREGNSAQTIAHELKLLRAATRHAAAMGAVVNTDMINGVLRDAWRLPKLPTKTRYLTVDEFRLVHSFLEPARPTSKGKVPAVDGQLFRQRQDAQDLLVALVMCGGRWSEVSGLLWSRIDLDKGVIRLWGNKTQQDRLVGIPDMMLEMLTRRHTERRPGQPLVFPTTLGAKRAGSCRVISRAIEACGLNSPERVVESGRATVHSLRHTYASLLLQNGATLADIQDALGHTSLAMTRRYAHLSKAESAGRLAGIMSKVIE